jgi:NDP-sugar pyrophosphorylase family protein
MVETETPTNIEEPTNVRSFKMTIQQAAVESSNTSSIKAVLESMRKSDVHNQALVGCSSMLNLSKETLEFHLQQWLWQEEDAPEYTGGELLYVIELGKIEEALVMEGLIYNDQ